jgi:2TM domain
MENRDEKLWRQAKKRVNTKKHGLFFLAIILFLWLIWLITNDFKISKYMSYPWPQWPTLGITIAFIFEYIDAFYIDNESSIEKEYEKLNKKK